jgi:hypothetical protein
MYSTFTCILMTMGSSSLRAFLLFLFFQMINDIILISRILISNSLLNPFLKSNWPKLNQAWVGWVIVSKLRIIPATLDLFWLSGISENLNENVDDENNTENPPPLNRYMFYTCPILWTQQWILNITIQRRFQVSWHQTAQSSIQMAPIFFKASTFL